ncbi:hypothetical protein [Mycobacterium sp.]|uniref:hypothetical protein n=1 Tax=Mycobacterium sp. TaxID=1785 RepID=UPI003F9AEA99
MSVKSALRDVRDGRRRVLLLQGRLWLAQLAMWPTAILLAIALSAGAWFVWRRNSRERHADTFTATPAPVDAPEPAVAGPAR